jgi:hypothetical protein
MGVVMNHMLGLVSQGLLTNLPSELIGFIVAAGVGYAWRRRRRIDAQPADAGGGAGKAPSGESDS